jgi:hypothetical protein
MFADPGAGTGRQRTHFRRLLQAPTALPGLHAEISGMPYRIALPQDTTHRAVPDGQ